MKQMERGSDFQPVPLLKDKFWQRLESDFDVLHEKLWQQSEAVLTGAGIKQGDVGCLLTDPAGGRSYQRFVLSNVGGGDYWMRGERGNFVAFSVKSMKSKYRRMRNKKNYFIFLIVSYINTMYSDYFHHPVPSFYRTLFPSEPRHK